MTTAELPKLVRQRCSTAAIPRWSSKKRMRPWTMAKATRGEVWEVQFRAMSRCNPNLSDNGRRICQRLADLMAAECGLDWKKVTKAKILGVIDTLKSYEHDI
jgi:hypothetical protein